MSNPTTCPYCNALVAAAQALTPSHRITCPRCGESFAVRGAAPDAENRATIAAGTAPTTSDKATSERNDPQSPTGRKPIVGRIIIAASLLAIVGILASWGVGHLQRTPSPSSPEKGTTPRTVAPADLAGLGYLPPQTDAVLALHVAQIADYSRSQGKTDAKGALWDLGISPDVLDWLESSTGLALEQIDHIAAGFRFERNAWLPRFVLVVETREPYDLAAVTEKLRAKPFRKAARQLYEVRSGQLLTLLMWPAADRVLLFALAQDDFDGVPQAPRGGTGHLPERLQSLIRDRVSPEAVFWLAAPEANWPEVAAPLQWISYFKGKKSFADSLHDMRALTVAATLDPQPSLTAQIELKDEEKGEEWRAYFSERFQDDGGQVQVGGSGTWCSLHTGMNPADLRHLTQKLLTSADGKK
jgi:Mu-like prophage protein Com